MRGVSKDGAGACGPSFEARPRGEHLRMTENFWRPPFINIKFFKFAGIVIPVPRTSLILLASCPMRGRFLEAIPQRTERKPAGPGRPGTVDGLMAGGAPGGAAPCLGRARSPCRARWVRYSRLKGATSLHPGASRRSTPLARLARDWQTSDALRRENAWRCAAPRGTEARTTLSVYGDLNSAR